MKEAELKVDLAIMGDEVIGTIQMIGPLYCHIEFAAELIREISKDSGNCGNKQPSPEIIVRAIERAHGIGA